MPRQQRVWLTNEIIRLRRKGFINGFIAFYLKVSYWTVAHIASQLIKKGLLKPQLRGSRRVREKKLIREQKIIQMHENGSSRKDITQALDITYDRLNKIMTELFGKGLIKKRSKKIHHQSMR